MDQKSGEYSSSSSDYEEEKQEFEFKFSFEESPSSELEHVVVATYGIQSVWLAEISKQNGYKKIGHLNFSKATQSALATVYQSNNRLSIVFNRDIKDYHYNDYNFGNALMAELKGKESKKTRYVVLTELNVNLLARKINISNLELRSFSSNPSFKQIEQPNEIRGLFADVYSKLLVNSRPVEGYILLVEDYVSSSSQFEQLHPLVKELQFSSGEIQKSVLIEEIKKLNKNKHKDIIYL